MIAWLWLSESLNGWRVMGLLVGFIGVGGLVMARTQVGLNDGADLALLACILAPVLYGFAANCAKRHLAGVSPMVVAAGSQTSAALALALPTLLAWPTNPRMAGPGSC